MTADRFGARTNPARTRGSFPAGALRGFAVSLVLGSSSAQADPVAICEQANRDYPAACSCIVEQARAAGIEGSVLDKLVANETTGIPMAVFQPYGLIFIQCIQKQVMAGIPGAASAGARALAPAQPVANAGTAGVGVVEATVLKPLGHRPDAAGIEVLPDTPPAGTWGPLGFGGPAGHAVQVGVLNDSGKGLLLSCTKGPGAAIIAGPFDNLSERLPVGQFVVEGGGGYTTDVSPVVIEDHYLSFPIFDLTVQKLRGGSRAIVDLSQSMGIRAGFALDGSGRAIGNFLRDQCGGKSGNPSLPWMPQALPDYFVNPGWHSTTVRLETPMLLPAVMSFSSFGSLGLVCEGRFVLSDHVPEGDFALTVDPYSAEPGRIVLPLVRVDGTLASQALPAAFRDRLAKGAVLEVFGPLGGTPRPAFSMRYSLAGFSALATGLTCPVPAPPRGEKPLVDLVGGPTIWAPSSIPLFPPPDSILGADFAPEAGIGMFIQCDGSPLFPGGAFDLGGTNRLLFELDDDPARQFRIDFGPWRAFLTPEGDRQTLETFYKALLGAHTVRVTVLDNTAFDVHFPLDGMKDALSAAGCPR